MTLFYSSIRGETGIIANFYGAISVVTRSVVGALFKR